MKYRPYKKDFDYSYTLGFNVTIELLMKQPKFVIEVIISSKAVPENGGEGTKKIVELCNANKINLRIDDKVINRLSPKENCFALAIFQKYEQKLAPENHIVLVNPSDAGNLGTIIRTALGFDFLNLAIITPAVDPFSPKVIRASLGAIFSLNLSSYDNINLYREAFPNNHFYPFMLKAKQTLENLSDIKHPFSLIFGNEASGLSDEYLNIGTALKISHNNSIDSLNLAVAVAIATHKLNNEVKK